MKLATRVWPQYGLFQGTLVTGQCLCCSDRVLTVGDEDPPATLARSDCGRGIAATIRAQANSTGYAASGRCRADPGAAQKN